MVQSKYKPDDLLPLSPAQMLFLEILSNNRHRIVPYEELIEILWPDPETQALGTTQVISLYACVLRGRGFPVFCRRGIGYRLVDETTLLRDPNAMHDMNTKGIKGTYVITIAKKREFDKKERRKVRYFGTTRKRLAKQRADRLRKRKAERATHSDC